MSVSSRLPTLIVSAVVVAGVALLAWKFFGPGGASSTSVDVTVPQLSARAKKGEVAFNENCVACHGANAGGSDQGPPLVHNIYNSGHHGDGAFFVAALRGVRGHHWSFGNMPRQPQVSKSQMTNIVRYVRELQIANGIGYQKHKM